MNGSGEAKGKGIENGKGYVDDGDGVEVQADGRQQYQLRPMTCEQGLLNRADGSCHYSQGKTAVFVAVYGPVGVKGYQEKSDSATIEVVFKPQKGQRGAKEREFELFIRQGLEAIILSSLHPRTGINVIIQVISDDGGLLSTSINAVCIALLDAGVAIRTQMVGVTACFVEEIEGEEEEGEGEGEEEKGGKEGKEGKEGRRFMLLDPTLEDEQRAVLVQHVAFINTNKEEDDDQMNDVLCCKTMGVMDEEEFFVCLDYCSSAADKVFQFIQESQKRKIKLESKLE